MSFFYLLQVKFIRASFLFIFLVFGHWTQDCDDEEVGIFMIFNCFMMMSLKLIRHSRDFKSNFPVKLKNAEGVK